MARADIKAGRAYVELFVKKNAFVRGLKNARDQMNRFGADMQALGQRMVAMSAGMIAPLAFSAKTFADFDDAMRAVAAVSGASEEGLRRLRDTAKELGRTTSFTAIEVGTLMGELGRAGFSADQIDAMTGSVLSLARATSTDAAQSAGIMAASIRQFGLGAEDASRVADGLTAAANKSFNTVEQLGEALSYAGPVASDFNLSFEDTLALLGALGNVGIQGSNAGTAIRRMLTLTGAEAEKLRGIFGVSFLDSAGNARPLVDVMSEINDATADLGSGDRAKKFNEAFGLLGITGASAIARSTGDVRELAQAIKEAGGIADETAKQMDGGLGGAFRIIMSAAEGLKIALGEALEKSLDRVVTLSTEMLGIATKWVEENQSAIVTFGKWAAAIGAAGAAILGIGLAAQFAGYVINGVIAIFGAVGAVITGIAAVIGFVLSPLGLLVAGVVAAGVAFFKFSDTGRDAMNSLRDTVSSALGQVRDIFNFAWGGIRDAIAGGDLELAADIAMTGLQLAVSQALDGISNLFGGTIGAIIDRIASGDFAGAWNSVVLKMKAVWEAFSEGVIATFAMAAKAVVDTWFKTVNKITEFIIDKASEGGELNPYNEFMKTNFGVDVAKEREREKFLNKQLGLKDDSVFDDISSGKFADPFFDETKARLDQMMRDATQASIDADNAVRDDATEASSALSAETMRLSDELLALRQKARVLREDTERGGTGGPGDDESGGGGGTGFGTGSSSKAVFSASAALALGQGGGLQKQMVDAIKEGNKQRKDLLEIDQNLLLEMRANKLFHA